MSSDNTPASVSGGSVFDIITTITAIVSYTLVIPIKYIFGTALPWLVTSLYTVLYHLIGYVVAFLRIALYPVLLPLDMLLWRPLMAIFLIVYQYRHLIYFTSSALLLGAVFGLSSFWFTTRISKRKEVPTLPSSLPDQDRKIDSPSPRQMYFSHTGVQDRTGPDAHSSTNFENESEINKNTYKSESKGSSKKSPSILARPPPHQADNSIKNKKMTQEHDQRDPILTKGVHSTGIRGDRFQDAMQALTAKRKNTRFAI